MASLLDISLLTHFQDVFVILFIFTIVYALLQLKSPFGANKGINAMIAFAVAMIFVFSGDAIDIVKQTVPWYVLILIVLTMAYFVSLSVGSNFTPELTKNIGTWVLVIGIIIFLINVSLKLGQGAGPFLGNSSIDPDTVEAGGTGDVGSGSYSQNFAATIFHPKVLAMILVLIVCLFAVLLIGYWI